MDAHAAHVRSAGTVGDDGLCGRALEHAHGAAVARRIAAGWELSGRILEALDEQTPGDTLREPGSLGRSLRFGRFAGALSVLQTNGVLDEDAARADEVLAGTETDDR